MGQNIEQLKKLLDFIDALSKEQGNEWFVEELKKRFGKSTTEFDSFIKLQREKNRKKARVYYKDIKNPTLKNQLIDHHANMLWYKSIFEIEQFFVYVNFQIENMLNYYINQTDAHKKILNNPKAYFREIGNDNYKIKVDCFSYFFDKNSGKNNPAGKISSLWAKLVFWSIDASNLQILENQFNNFSAIINIRNDQNHANYLNESKSAVYWKNMEDDFSFAFIYAIIKTIRSSIISI